MTPAVLRCGLVSQPEIAPGLTGHGHSASVRHTTVSMTPIPTDRVEIITSVQRRGHRRAGDLRLSAGPRRS